MTKQRYDQMVQQIAQIGEAIHESGPRSGMMYVSTGFIGDKPIDAVCVIGDDAIKVRLLLVLMRSMVKSADAVPRLIDLLREMWGKTGHYIDEDIRRGRTQTTEADNDTAGAE